jgi:hypothetical protein
MPQPPACPSQVRESMPLFINSPLGGPLPMASDGSHVALLDDEHMDMRRSLAGGCWGCWRAAAGAAVWRIGALFAVQLQLAQAAGAAP